MRSRNLPRRELANSTLNALITPHLLCSARARSPTHRPSRGKSSLASALIESLTCRRVPPSTIDVIWSASGRLRRRRLPRPATPYSTSWTRLKTVSPRSTRQNSKKSPFHLAWSAWTRKFRCPPTTTVFTCELLLKIKCSNRCHAFSKVRKMKWTSSKLLKWISSFPIRSSNLYRN